MAGAIAGTAILNCSHTDRLHTVTLTINDRCNLNCPHCYLQYRDEAALISDDVLDIMFKSQFSHLAIVGKEPLYSISTATLCCEIAARCSKSRKSFSIITNGLRLSLIPPSALQDFSFIDISFDGGPLTYRSYRRGNFEDVIRGIDYLRTNDFRSINALHVLNSNTISAVADMMSIAEYAQFGSIMFSPYIVTSNYGSNTVRSLKIQEIFETLAACKSFVDNERAFLLIDFNHLNEQRIDAEECLSMAGTLGLVGKIKMIVEDPLLFGIIRVTFDGLVLTPQQSIHPRDYADCAFRLNKKSGGLETIYDQMNNQYCCEVYEN